MPEQTFYICLNSMQSFTGEDYYKNAGIMNNILCDIFTSTEKIGLLTKNVDLTKSHMECELNQEEGCLQAKAVWDVQSDYKIVLDKTKLSNLIKQSAPWTGFKLEKRTLTQSEHHAPAVVA